MRNGQTAILLSILIFTAACRQDVTFSSSAPLLSIPAGFPEPVFPEGNDFTEARWKLGKKLFFDPIMSRDSTISCGSCHLPEHAFSDTRSFSPGVDNAAGTRNAPSLANVAYHPYFTREGGVQTLEMQVLVPIQEHNEFDFNILLIQDRLMADSTYRQMSWGAYEREPDYFVITRAIATFERSLLSGESPYDSFNQGEDNAVSETVKRGMQLFFSKRTSCSTCHSDFNFTNYAFENNGLYLAYADPGRFRLTGKETDRARFKVAGLRNVALTAPYMHDGSILTLEEVLDHYNSGGKAHPNKNSLIQPLRLSSSEKSDIISFLHSLTDENFIQNEKFRPE